MAIRTHTQVTGWSDEGALELNQPTRRSKLEARASVLATGCRERPRAARLVPGSRPQGVLTTGALQQLVYLLGERSGRRAVVVGAEHVSFSALLTLAHGGARAVAMVTEQPDTRRSPPSAPGQPFAPRPSPHPHELTKSSATSESRRSSSRTS